MPENLEMLDELQTIVGMLDKLSERGHEGKINEPLEELKNAAEKVGHAASGSWLGYHAHVYYRDFQTPPLTGVGIFVPC